MKKIISLTILLLSFGIFMTSAFAATPCPAGSSSGDCVATDLQLNKVDLRRFFPTLSFNDLISSVATLILVGLVILFGFRIILAGFKWVNNDAQDKAKKDAIKSITNGIIGIAITFFAYFIVIFVRSVTAGNDQLVSCASLYVRDVNSYNQNLDAGINNKGISGSTDEFQRCMRLAGKYDVFTDVIKYNKFTQGIFNDCQGPTKYFHLENQTNSTAPTGNSVIVVTDASKLNQCFIDQINKI